MTTMKSGGGNIKSHAEEPTGFYKKCQYNIFHVSNILAAP